MSVMLPIFDGDDRIGIDVRVEEMSHRNLLSLQVHLDEQTSLVATLVSTRTSSIPTTTVLTLGILLSLVGLSLL